MAKETALFQNLPQEDRIEALKGLASKTEFQKVRRHYSEDEKQQMKDFISEEGITIMDQEEEFSKIKKEFSKAIKDNKAGVKDALVNLKRGYSENEEVVFMIDNQEEGEMNIYDSKGCLILSRPLFPEERQTKILGLSNNTGTNG